MTDEEKLLALLEELSLKTGEKWIVDETGRPVIAPKQRMM